MLDVDLISTTLLYLYLPLPELMADINKIIQHTLKAELSQFVKPGDNIFPICISCLEGTNLTMIFSINNARVKKIAQEEI